jgi:hypothetical protein
LNQEISQRKLSTNLPWNRKVSVPISMPQTLLQDIDKARGDIARSVFVCKILLAGVNVERGAGAK